MGRYIYNVLLKSTLSLLTTCWHMTATYCSGLNKACANMICRSVQLFLLRINLFILHTCSLNCMQNSYIDHVHHDHTYQSSMKKDVCMYRTQHSSIRWGLLQPLILRCEIWKHEVWWHLHRSSTKQYVGLELNRI